MSKKTANRLFLCLIAFVLLFGLFSFADRKSNFKSKNEIEPANSESIFFGDSDENDGESKTKNNPAVQQILDEMLKDEKLSEITEEDYENYQHALDILNETEETLNEPVADENISDSSK